MRRFLLVLLFSVAAASMQSAAQYSYYDIGTPELRDIWVDPVHGDDGNDGSTQEQALRTLSAAWQLVPIEQHIGEGHRIRLRAGTYAFEEGISNYYSEKHGSRTTPIIIEGEGAENTVILGGLNIADVSYLYLMNLTLWAGNEAGAGFGNNVLHIDNGDNILLRNLVLRGPTDCIADTCNSIQEVLKINQADFVYVENCTMSGTYQTVLDFFSVQYGHILDCTISRSGGRCAYLKGGSAYFTIAGNTCFDCREAGIQAGEGSNLAFLRRPWIHYEAYDIKIINNVLHDIYGAGLSVQGGYNILMAHNTLYRIGLDDEAGRSWTMFQAVHGARTCTPAEEFGNNEGTRARCEELLDAGGWGTAQLGADSGGAWIPNRNVFVYNNIFANPAGTGTRYAHIAVNGPATLPPHARNIASPSRTDDNIRIGGNIFSNTLLEGTSLIGSTDGSEPGCGPGNPECNETRIFAENAINTIDPLFVDPAAGNFRPRPGSAIFSVAALSIPDFSWSDAPSAPPVPEGALSNTVSVDFDGKARSVPVVGAFATDTETGVDANNGISELRLYPNPAHERIAIEFPSAVRAVVEIRDMYGRLVRTLYTGNDGTAFWDCRDASLLPVAQGTYTAVIRSRSRVQTIHFLVR